METEQVKIYRNPIFNKCNNILVCLKVDLRSFVARCVSGRKMFLSEIFLIFVYLPFFQGRSKTTALIQAFALLRPKVFKSKIEIQLENLLIYSNFRAFLGNLLLL